MTSGFGAPAGGRLPEGASFLAKPYTADALSEAIGAGMSHAHSAAPALRA